MNPFIENPDTQFWQAVAQRLTQQNIGHDEIATMITGYVKRMIEVSDLRLVYHQGVEATVGAIRNVGYMTHPQLLPIANAWQLHEGLRDFMA